MASAHSYRSKIEVLRDFLRAAGEPAPKTRIIGSANLNPLSFRRYLKICMDRDLIASVSGGYVATPRAAALLEAIDGLMGRAGDLERAFQELEAPTADGRPADGNGQGAFRQIYRQAWNEIVLRPLAPAVEPGSGWVVVPRTDRSGALLLSPAGGGPARIGSDPARPPAVLTEARAGAPALGSRRGTPPSPPHRRTLGRAVARRSRSKPSRGGRRGRSAWSRRRPSS